MRVRRSKYLLESVELNITAFLNLMVILVPFLLITAVFSRMTVLELNLPALDAKTKSQAKIDLQLQILIRESSFDIKDARLGLIKRFERSKKQTNWGAFSELLVEIKTRFPEETQIALLLDPTVSYKTLIHVMDRVRSAEVVNVATLETVELFPDISIGDAPVVSPDVPEVSSGQVAETET